MYRLNKDDIVMAAGGPMGSPVVPVFAKYFQKLENAKQFAEDDFGKHIEWQTHQRSTLYTSGDLGAYQYTISLLEVEDNKPKPRAKRKPSQREDGPRARFSVEKASEGGQSFASAKAALEAAGIVDVRHDYSPYVGQYGLSVPGRFKDKANDVLFPN